jgi:hypothetical protein
MVVFLSDWVSQIPMAALVAVMIMVSIGTFSWDSIRNLRQFPLSSNIVMLATVAVTVYTHNLAYGVFVGVLLAALFHQRCGFVQQLGCCGFHQKKRGWDSSKAPATRCVTQVPVAGLKRRTRRTRRVVVARYCSARSARALHAITLAQTSCASAWANVMRCRSGLRTASASNA